MSETGKFAGSADSILPEKASPTKGLMSSGSKRKEFQRSIRSPESVESLPPKSESLKYPPQLISTAVAREPHVYPLVTLRTSQLRLERLAVKSFRTVKIEYR